MKSRESLTAPLRLMTLTIAGADYQFVRRGGTVRHGGMVRFSQFEGTVGRYGVLVRHLAECNWLATVHAEGREYRPERSSPTPGLAVEAALKEARREMLAGAGGKNA